MNFSEGNRIMKRCKECGLRIRSTKEKHEEGMHHKRGVVKLRERNKKC